MASVAHTISKSRHRKPMAAISQKKDLDRTLRTELIGFSGYFEGRTLVDAVRTL
jgi:hypothetical protein